jgi:hypothetical protein
MLAILEARRDVPHDLHQVRSGTEAVERVPVRMRHACLFALLSGAAIGAAAAQDAISTDRPDFVESSDVVGRGRVQLETGVAFERDRAATATLRTLTTPTLLRLGTGDRWELRFETDGRTEASYRDALMQAQVRGWSDLAIGIKWRQQAADAERHRPGIAVLVHVDLDSGSVAFRGEGLRPSLRAVWEWELAADAALGIMPGIVYDRVAGHRFVNGLLAATYSRPLAPRLRGFLEVAGQQLAAARNGGCVVTYDAGLTYLLGVNAQLDAAASRGANEHSPDWSWGAGVSLRF